MKFKVVHTYPIAGVDLGEKLLEAFDASLVKTVCRTEDEIIRIAEDADAVIGVVSLHPFNRRVLKALSKCRIVAGMGIGFDTTDLEAATEYGIVVTNVPDYCLDEVSGLAIAFMLTLGHKIPQLDKAVKERQINLTTDRKAVMDLAHPIFRMRDQTVGVIGFGKIGTTTALKAKGLGMKVIAYDPYVLGPVMESHGVKPVDMRTLLRDSDFISLHIPLTVETAKMIGYQEFKEMKRTGYFINTARGGCVDQTALVRALKEGLIAGAGIDVTVDEPISPGNPLLKIQNVILTGHAAWYSVASEAEVHYKPMTQVALALNGEWPLYAVNPEVKKNWMNRWGRKV